MPPGRLATELAKVISAHGATFTGLNRRRRILLELSALMLAVQHYEKSGYRATPMHLLSGRFVAKWWSRGDPRDSSWWQLDRGGTALEAHLNAPVWDGFSGVTATFVVDVGVITKDAKPRIDNEKKDIRGFENKDLHTFIESKSLPIYPMLVAQFIGTAEEVKPWVLSGATPPEFDAASHFDPALVSRGGPSANTDRLLGSLAKRGFRIRVVPAFDRYVEEGRLATSRSPSVLARDPKSVWPQIDWT